MEYQARIHPIENYSILGAIKALKGFVDYEKDHAHVDALLFTLPDSLVGKIESSEKKTVGIIGHTSILFGYFKKKNIPVTYSTIEDLGLATYVLTSQMQKLGEKSLYHICAPEHKDASQDFLTQEGFKLI